MKMQKRAEGFNEGVLAHLKQCGQPHHNRLGNFAYYIADAILEQHSIDNLESLIRFCKDPDNLGTWLPHEADRLIYANQLTERLSELRETPEDTLAAICS